MILERVPLGFQTKGVLTFRVIPAAKIFELRSAPVTAGCRSDEALLE